jgi:flavin reductase (DIM6/NTAB) family NADH-FMN oxidoreductase RutF
MLSAHEFKAAFRNHPAGVALITAEGPEGPVAMTATSVSSASVTPPLLVFSVSELSSSAPAIREAETLVVHLLEAEQLHLAKLGATSGIDRFADTSLWTRLPTGEPYFPSASSWIRGRVVGTVPAGVATIVLVEALEAHVQEAQSSGSTHPLVYHNRTWHRLGDHSRID